jgi:plasmid stabilization system protein ParE
MTTYRVSRDAERDLNEIFFYWIQRGRPRGRSGKYLIYYRRTRRGTEILHIFYGARNQRRTFKKR